MLKDITLGQYFPGDSPLHRADPRMKIILTALYITAVFMCGNAWSFALVVAATVVMISVSRIPMKMVLRGIKPIILIIVFSTVINVFWTQGEKLLLSFYFIKVYYEGVVFAVFMIVRIVALLAGTSVVLTYTTSPISLTDGLEQLLEPLKKLKVPVHEFAMMMTIALRFIPTLIEETDKIMNAQKARGADFTSGGVIQRAKALIPVLIPLFISAFRRADELAVAMECRCYRGGEGRTRMNVLKYSGLDFVMLALFLLLIAAIAAFNRFAPGVSI